MQTTHFVKSRAHSPRPTSKIIAIMIALRRAILMKADPVVSLHAHRLFSGRAGSCRKTPVWIHFFNLLSSVDKEAFIEVKWFSGPIYTNTLLMEGRLFHLAKWQEFPTSLMLCVETCHNQKRMLSSSQILSTSNAESVTIAVTW